MNTTQIFEPIREGLALVEAKLRQPPPGEYEILTAAAEHLFSSGGKRIRPALALLAGRLYSTEREKIVALAAAVEMLHTATLVHDDLIDGAFLRRGLPTLNAQWSPGATVLAGDYLFARAAHLAAQTDNVQVMKIFAQTLMAICTGELKQQFVRDRLNHDRRDYYERIQAKTAVLFTCATEATGVLSGAPEAHIKALHDYGHNLGMAFQIVDDVLDFEGDEAKLGKPVGSDLAQGLVTLPALYYLEQHPPGNPVSAVLNRDGKQRTPEAVACAVEAVRQSGAIGAALAEAKDFTRRSQEALEHLPDGPAREPLYGLAQFVVQRQV